MGSVTNIKALKVKIWVPANEKNSRKNYYLTPPRKMAFSFKLNYIVLEYALKRGRKKKKRIQPAYISKQCHFPLSVKFGLQGHT